MIDFELVKAACCFAVCMFAWLVGSGVGLALLVLGFIPDER